MNAAAAIGIGAAIVAALAVFCWLQNNLLTVSRFRYSSSKISQPLRLVQLSDLHSKSFGKQNERLLKRIRRIAPDFILLTGDMIDRHDRKECTVKQTLLALTKIAPVIYASGNHEYSRIQREAWFTFFEQHGILVLRHKETTLYKNGQKIFVLGLDEYGWRIQTQKLLTSFEKHDGIKIVLSHCPHFFPDYRNFKIDIVLSGHAHGGQFWFPFCRGFFAPGQGLFPKYCGGCYEEQGTRLIVSRGLGNSGFPLRLFNFPNIVLLCLEPEKR